MPPPVTAGLPRRLFQAVFPRAATASSNRLYPATKSA